MNAIHHLITGHANGGTGYTLLRHMANMAARASEPFWLCLTFLLFIIMGPFSVIAVVYGLWALAHGENREKMTEPARC